MQDTWSVRVIRPNRAEFQAWEGEDEAEAREQYQMWKEDGNVSKVGLFINGQWAEHAYERRSPGRPKERSGEYEHTAIDIRRDLLTKLDTARGSMSRREFVEQWLESF